MSSKSSQLVDKAGYTKPSNLKAKRRTKEPIIKAVKTSTGTYRTQSAELPLPSVKQTGIYYVPDYALDPDRIRQQPIKVFEQPMVHIQDRWNPYILRKDDTYFERIIAIRSGDTNRREFTVLPCGPYY